MIGAECMLPAGPGVEEVAVDPEGTLWLLAAGVLLKLDVNHSRFPYCPKRSLAGQSLARNADGIIWRRSAANTSARGWGRRTNTGAAADGSPKGLGS